MRLAKLIIDADLERLIPHLSEKEFELLENSLLNEGCREPISIWNNTILDGHNRYRICKKHGIPFKTQHVEINSKDEAIIWICVNQMGRRNITEETRYYLIGKRYEAEKRIGAKNPRGRNQYSEGKEVLPAKEGEPLNSHKGSVKDRACETYTAVRLGKMYNKGHNAIEGYGRYAKAIDKIDHIAPGLSSMVLRGDIYLSKKNVVMISEMANTQIQQIADTITEGARGHIQYDEIMSMIDKKDPQPQRNLRTVERVNTPATLGEQTVKDIPEYDPDSEISTLTFTMPSWRASIGRIMSSTDLSRITDAARQSFRQELILLNSALEELIKQL